MPRRDGAFLCMVVAGKQLAFSLRFTALIFFFFFFFDLVCFFKKLCKYLLAYMGIFLIHIHCRMCGTVRYVTESLGVVLVCYLEDQCFLYC